MYANSIKEDIREGAKFIETGAGHTGTGAVTFYNTVNHRAVTDFHLKIAGHKLYLHQKMTGQEVIFNPWITGQLLLHIRSWGYFFHLDWVVFVKTAKNRSCHFCGYVDRVWFIFGVKNSGQKVFIEEKITGLPYCPALVSLNFAPSLIVHACRSLITINTCRK